MSDRNEQEKLARAAHAVERMERFRRAFEDPDVKAFFEAYEKDRIGEMVKCDPSDDQGRRDAALRIRAMQEFRSYITAAIGAGHRAEQTLAKGRDNDGR